jgi:magnesium-transporting ATPase (P-type)
MLTALALAFATIPEELPILIAGVLAVGSLALAASGVFVKVSQPCQQGADTALLRSSLVVNRLARVTYSQFRCAGQLQSILLRGSV